MYKRGPSHARWGSGGARSLFAINRLIANLTCSWCERFHKEGSRIRTLESANRQREREKVCIGERESTTSLEIGDEQGRLNVDINARDLRIPRSRKNTAVNVCQYERHVTSVIPDALSRREMLALCNQWESRTHLQSDYSFKFAVSVGRDSVTSTLDRDAYHRKAPCPSPVTTYI